VGGCCEHGDEPSEKAGKEYIPWSELVSLLREIEVRKPVSLWEFLDSNRAQIQRLYAAKRLSLHV